MNLTNAAPAVNPFPTWQPIYAERGITIIPCGPDKIPLVRNPQKFGRGAAAQIASKFSNAPAFGYYCGRRNGITVLDIDVADERVLAHAMAKHGKSPVVVRTGSGKFHALYRHNGERRRVRAWDGVPIDLLGAGLAIAPPSRVAKGQYEIIEGSLDDLDRLPIMHGLEDRLYVDHSTGPRPQAPRPQREGEGRNSYLFNRLLLEAHSVDDYDALLDRAETLNGEIEQPMEHAEVETIARNAWRIEEQGTNRKGSRGAWFTTDETNMLIDASPDEYLLLGFLRANNHPDSTFWVANGLAERFGWSRQRLAAARAALIRRGYFWRFRDATNNQAALYRWSLRAGSKRRDRLVEDRCQKSDTPTKKVQPQSLAEIREALGYRACR